ncbi:MAG TPA: hypothetical protein VGR02_01850 [Thermoanaerobaculia bacterium]|nr:hypothetical protein [Thermoanaerobaculia bacterium]
MPFARSLLVLSLLAAALPLAAATHEPLLVLIDLPNHRALVPEGSVVPPGMTFRAEPLQGRDRTLDPSERRSGPRLEGSLLTHNLRRLLTPPLTIEYAPAERFVQARQNYDMRVKKAAERRDGHGLISVAHTADNCFPTYIQDSKTGVYGTYYNGLTSTFCQQSSGIANYAYLDWSFTASGDYSDDDEYIDPYALVWDDNNHFRCVQYAVGYTSPVECTASNHTQLLQVGCLNTVSTSAVLYTIEYLSGYQPNYLAYVISTDYCTYFY